MVNGYTQDVILKTYHVVTFPHTKVTKRQETAVFFLFFFPVTPQNNQRNKKH